MDLQCGCQNSANYYTACGRGKPRDAQHEKISFLLMDQGLPCLAIFLVTRRRWNHKVIRNTIEACENAGIPWQRYFIEYDNKPEYVIKRIREGLK